MKLRLEPQKTTLRLSKDEFQTLLEIGELSESTLFPCDNALYLHVKLDEAQSFKLENNRFLISLPNHQLKNYHPAKTGLSFKFQIDSQMDHKLIFEVDIKKKPLRN